MAAAATAATRRILMAVLLFRAFDAKVPAGIVPGEERVANS
jgi:hypothetical protein